MHEAINHTSQPATKEKESRACVRTVRRTSPTVALREEPREVEEALQRRWHGRVVELRRVVRSFRLLEHGTLGHLWTQKKREERGSKEGGEEEEEEEEEDKNENKDKIKE